MKNKINKGNSALVVIDWLNDFAVNGGALYTKNAERARPYIIEVLKYARSEDMVVVYANDAHEKDDPEFALYGPHAIKGTFGAKIAAELNPRKDEMIFEKTTYNGFTNPLLAEELRAKGIENIFEVGLITNICVLQTAKGAVENNFKPYVIKEAVAELEGADLEKDFEEIKKYAILVILDEFKKMIGR